MTRKRSRTVLRGESGGNTADLLDSIENIHKVIDPLFLDDLRAELANILEIKVNKTRLSRLEDFSNKLSSLTFLDPACGSGNFLTETYISLRRLENEALRAIYDGQKMFNLDGLIKVGIHQFYGIEINDFAVTVAKTALWIAESQMMRETEEIVEHDLDFLPLKSYANITEANALRIDWADVVPKEKLSYIMGNPPFIGASMMTKEQKKDAVKIFGKIKLSNSIDYVGAWYFKSCDLIKATNIKVALVSTNSITQGEQVAPLWETLFNRYNIHIDFAYRTFRWDSEANLKAHVHCVIIGFSASENSGDRKLYNSDKFKIVKNINPYLIDAPDIFIQSKSKPICDVPEMVYGNKPTNGGLLFLTPDERESIIKKEPKISKYIKQIYGATEFINNKLRYCIWLVNASPADIRNSKFLSERVAGVKEFRLNSTKEATKRSAETSTLFQEIRQPTTTYILIPRHSSENKRYIPFGFVQPDIIVNDAVQIIPNATLYHFGVLTSNVHMAWVRTVCGRLKSDYRYSKDIVYNNFPFPNSMLEQKERIEHTAQAILNARALYPDCSLADLYDELTMPPELRKAHQANDFAVMTAYGLDKKITESECVAELMKLYQKLTK